MPQTLPTLDIRDGHINRPGTDYSDPPELWRLKAEEIEAIRGRLIEAAYTVTPFDLYVNGEETITNARRGRFLSVSMGDEITDPFGPSWWVGVKAGTVDVPLDSFYSVAGELRYIQDERGTDDDNVFPMLHPKRFRMITSASSVALADGVEPGRCVILTGNGAQLQLPPFATTTEGWFCWVQSTFLNQSISSGDADFRETASTSVSLGIGDSRLIVRGSATFWETLAR